MLLGQEEGALGPLPVKKPRGRPKGSKKVTTVSGRMVEPSAGKRPRGRPRKWESLEKMVPGLAKLLVLGGLRIPSLPQLSSVPPVHTLLKPEDWEANRNYNVIFQILPL
ncbi:high mobility group protein HMGI-C-like protein [Amazona aestiva]|uniref:High mobility group protein HMGI-C-like protein n=1 Tax=Amazona aestiva TaxID=12930 RepID=A0A0Q3PQW9_AMAAE|nr:high mobility group protein HMGI-C-like protein [Amazona aestiva]